MPCYTPPPTEEELRTHYYKEFTHNSPLAEMLCTAMEIIDNEGDAFKHTTRAMREWWVLHQVRDRKRKK